MVNKEFRAWNTREPYGKGRLEKLVYFKLTQLDEDYIISSGTYIDTNAIVMQYIGRKDIDGKKAFEGDFIQNLNDPTDIKLIKFYEDAIANGCEPFIEIAWSGWQDAGDREFRIIGNKFENPELRKLINE